MKTSKIPHYDQLLNSTFQALKKLGGSGDIEEIYDEIVAMYKFSDELLNIPHSASGSQTELSYRLAWARTYLKKFGAIANSARGVWVITNEFKNKDGVDNKEVVKKVKALEAPKTSTTDELAAMPLDMPEENKPWREKLREILLNISPSAFERLTKRLLRECGLTQVEVKGQTGDGGIDGIGLLKMNGIIGFKLAFQCKRYAGSVPPSLIRDFRGSLTTDIEKGLFVTTGVFTKAAKDEAKTAGKIAIELMDGEELISKLAELNIGLKEVVTYEIDEEFYRTL